MEKYHTQYSVNNTLSSGMIRSAQSILVKMIYVKYEEHVGIRGQLFWCGNPNIPDEPGQYYQHLLILWISISLIWMSIIQSWISIIQSCISIIQLRISRLALLRNSYGYPRLNHGYQYVDYGYPYHFRELYIHNWIVDVLKDTHNWILDVHDYTQLKIHMAIHINR